MPYIDSGGVPIYFKVSGEGFPVVLHTGGGGDGTMWKQSGYVTGLGRFRAILLDHRGHGQSGKPRDLEAHSMECYVADVIAALAAAHPDRVAGLIVMGGFGNSENDTPEGRARAEETARVARKRGVGGFVEGAFASEGIDIPDWFIEQMRATDAEMFALEVLGVSSWHGPWSILSRIMCAVLMLAGKLEDPDGNNSRMAEVLHNARSVTFPGLGHIGAYVRSDLALAEAVPFLQDVVQRERAGQQSPLNSEPSGSGAGSNPASRQ